MALPQDPSTELLKQVIVASVASVVVNRKAEAAGCSMAHLGPKGALRMRLLGLLQRPGVPPLGCSSRLNTIGYSSTYLARGVVNVRAGTWYLPRKHERGGTPSRTGSASR